MALIARLIVMLRLLMLRLRLRLGCDDDESESEATQTTAFRRLRLLTQLLADDDDMHIICIYITRAAHQSVLLASHSTSIMA